MKHATTAKLPKETSAKVNDPDNPAWTEDMLGAPVLKRGRGPLASLRSRFLMPHRPLWRYCLIAAPVALVPSLLLTACALGILRLFNIDVQRLSPPKLQPTTMDFLGTVVLSPAVETLLLAGLIAALLRLGLRPALAVVVSAVFWGGVHGLFAPFWFFGTVWSFLVFSCAYVAWRKVSFGSAFVAASVPHALVNLFAYGLSLLDM